MAWHTFETGNTYSTLQALAVCWNRLESGAVADVPDKLKMLEWIRRLAPERVVFAPFSSGWGASPLNPNCWQVPGGGRLMDGATIAEPQTATDI